MKRNRYPKFHQGPNGEHLCRGCGKPVPPSRQTWCSRECYHRHCPAEVRGAVYERDRGVCALCGCDTEKLYKEVQFKRDALKDIGWTKQYATYHDYCEALRNITPSGFQGICGDWWHADHIREFSEGGETVLENMQTLCIPCHKKKTKEWRQRRKEEK